MMESGWHTGLFRDWCLRFVSIFFLSFSFFLVFFFHLCFHFLLVSISALLVSSPSPSSALFVFALSILSQDNRQHCYFDFRTVHTTFSFPMKSLTDTHFSSDPSIMDTAVFAVKNIQDWQSTNLWNTSLDLWYKQIPNPTSLFWQDTLLACG